jgi:hypothetical protein
VRWSRGEAVAFELEFLSAVADRLKGRESASVKYIKMDEEELNRELRNLAERALPDTFKAGIWKSIRTGSAGRGCDGN